MSVRDLVILGCSSQQPTRFRNHGAYLLRWNNEGFLFDPGEGTQRQFILANVSPTTVTRILISHFHGDHCLGLGSMLMRLNLDKIEHTVYCYYPESGKKYFNRLRYCASYHDKVNVIERPVSKYGLVDDLGDFILEAFPLNHSIENIGWKVTEKNKRRYLQEALFDRGINGLLTKELIRKGHITVNNKTTHIEEVSYIKNGDTFAYVSDTRPCEGAFKTANNAKLLLCESTYQEKEKKLAWEHYHMTASQAAKLALEAKVQHLVLTHYSSRYIDLKPFLQESRSIFTNTILAEDNKIIPFIRS